MNSELNISRKNDFFFALKQTETVKTDHIVADVTSKEKSEGSKEFQVLKSESYSNMDKVGMCATFPCSQLIANAN